LTYFLIGEVARKAVARLRKGNGPFFLECKTYRWHKHFLSHELPDLRPKKELETWKKKCPVRVYEKRLLKQGILTPRKLAAMNARIMDAVEEANQYALASPYPKPQDALQDVYSK
jgi:TPP-dependent pyruvate/acetoin dehydrogenase alpha subunit